MDKYRILQVIGEGTYGKVFKAQERETGRVVAIKKFKQREDEDPHVRKTMMREIRILREYRHVNIVNLRTVFRENGKLYLIFDYVPRTLLEELQATPDGLPFDRIKSITYQILKANNFLHEGNIMHRDIKPENLLISRAGVVKICDFGFARPLNSSNTYQYTDYVSTRWYRAPELLVGDAAYSGTVDVWAIGCIFAEIFNGMPLFPGESDLHTLQLILETLTADDMEHEKPIQELSKKQRVAFRMNPLFDKMKVPLASESIKSPETVNEVSLKALLKDINETQLDFIRRCLAVDGGQRANMQELLEHPVFDEEFRASYDAKIQEMTEADERGDQALMEEVLTTKDGRPELGPEDLVTEDEKNDENDEFDDDDSSSAVGSPATSTDETPDSSSGVERNKPRDLLIQNTGLEDLKDNEQTSVKTAVPFMGDGIAQADGSSVDALLPQGSVLSVSLQRDKSAEKGTGSSSVSSVDGHSKALHLHSKNLEAAPPGSQDASLIQALPTGTAANLEESKSRDVSAEGKDSSDVSAEQLQITRGVNGTASLQQAAPKDETTSTQNAPAKKVQEKSESNSGLKGPIMEPHDISVRVAGAPVKDYQPVEVNSVNAAGHEIQAPQVQKAQKRTSLNHYMIESSITEEIREENQSERSSSDQPSPSGGEVREDHVIVREGVTSMFQHPASVGETEEGTDNGGVVTPDAATSGLGLPCLSNSNLDNKNQNTVQLTSSADSIAQIKKGANIISKDPGSANGHEATPSVINSQTETKMATEPRSSEMPRTGSEEAARTGPLQINRAQTQDAASKQGLATGNSNPEPLKQQHTENLAAQGNPADKPLLSHTQSGKSKSGGAPQISKVNITFGVSQPGQGQDEQSNTVTSSQNPLINKQVTDQGATGAPASAHKGRAENSAATDGATSILASQVKINGAVSGGASAAGGSAAGLSNAAAAINAGNNSSRVGTNSTNAANMQRNSLSLKQPLPGAAMHQTAREFTPSKKPSLVGPSPQTTLQQQSGALDGSGLGQTASNAMDSTAAKTNQSRGALNGGPQQEMSVTQFTGKPIYQVQPYPQTQVKSVGPKQAAVLKQTSSLEKFDNRGLSPHKLPNLKQINSSLSQYQNAPKPTTSDEHRIGDGLLNLQQQHSQNRPGPNSITNHFSSHQQRYPHHTNMGQSINGGKLASGSTQSLTTKMHFTSQKYHRASNSQTNEPAIGASKQVANAISSVAANAPKKSQLIQPMKLVAFPKLAEDSAATNVAGVMSPKAGQQGATAGAQTLTNTLVGSRQRTNSQAPPTVLSKSKPSTMPKKAAPPQTMIQHYQQLQNQHVQQQQHNGKAQTNKMPKRYSDLGGVPTGQAKFANVQGGQAQSNTTGAHAGPTFHPTVPNEYMLSQDSLVNEANSRPSRQSSNNLEQPIGQQHAQQNSVESYRPRNQATQHLSSQTKTRGELGPHGHVVNQSFLSTMKSKNNKFIHQNSSTNHHPSNKANSTSVSGIGAAAKPNHGQPPATTDQKVHQHFLEQFSEAPSQRQSLSRPKNTGGDSLGPPQKTPMTSLFQKSKFFQSSAGVENQPPNTSLKVQPAYHQQQLSSNGGQKFDQTSQSPNRVHNLNTPYKPATQSGSSTVQQQAEITMISNFTEKDSFPRRNITNKLRNASNQQHKKGKFQQFEAQPQAATSSPSPLGLHQHRDSALKATNASPGGVVLPNLGQTSSSTNPASMQAAAPGGASNATSTSAFMNVQEQQQPQGNMMQVSLTQLRSTAGAPHEQHRTNNNFSQSPHVIKGKVVGMQGGGQLAAQKLSAAANVVQLNASEFNLRFTNNSQLSTSGGKGQAMPYQQIVRKPPSVIQPGRAHQYQMYLTPSQNYTSGTNQSHGANRSKNGKAGAAGKAGAPNAAAKGIGNGSSPTALNKKISYENSLQVQKIKHQVVGVQPKGSPVIGGVSYKVKTETDWHRGSQQQLFDVASIGGPSNQLYRVSNQYLEKSISPQRIQQAMKRGSNVQMMSSQGGIGGAGGGGPSSNYTENKINFSNQQQKRRQTNAALEVGPSSLYPGAASSGIIHDSSQDSLPVQSPNLLRKKFVSKQQNQIK